MSTVRRVGRRAASLAGVLLLAACGGPAASPGAGAQGDATPSETAGTAAPPAPGVTQHAAPGPPLAEPAPQPPSPDELAGLLSREVPERGAGATVVVPGSAPAPAGGTEHRVRVEVEGGLAVDGEAFASFVLGTLNDKRSWAADGHTFSRTDGDADVIVVLASPETSAAMCRPLQTNGKLSCRKGPRAIITHHRWVHGSEDYGDDLTGYRQYVVNHEVGHYLGRGHVDCPAGGAPAPVMQQQTMDVDPCVPNPWPYP